MTTTALLKPPPETHAKAARRESQSPARPHDSIFVRCISEDSVDLLVWQQFIDRHEGATLFHGLEWMRAVRAAFGHTPFFLIATRGDSTIGVLPLFQVNSLIAGRLLVSVPYATYGGVLADCEEAGSALLEHARELARTIGARSIDLRSIEAADGLSPVATSHAFFRKPLQTSGDLAEMLPRKARAAARRAAERYPLATEFDQQNLRTVWDLYSRSMRRLASPNYPMRFFEALRQELGERFVVQLVRCDGHPVAGLVSFVHRDVMMPYFIGIDERLDLYGLSHYLYLESMRWAVIAGLRVYDFGRSRYDNAGPFEFKKMCGFEPQALQYQTIVMAGKSAPDLASNSPRYAVVRRMWKHLPLAVTRPLGGFLSASLPG
jgi:FemAB-related protein (PEP-CTERM system-associated)